MRIAVVKPDHLGDLILSSAAYRAVRARYQDASLFVSSRNLRLARLLFPDADIRVLDLPHLCKGPDKRSSGMDFVEFDLVLFLRNDYLLNPERVLGKCNDFIFFPANDRYHQTILDYVATSRVVGRYDIDHAFYNGAGSAVATKALIKPRRVGLCIGAGFHANAWPATHWIELGRALIADGVDIRVICGPSETVVAGLIGTALQLNRGSVIQGGDDFGAFLAEVGELDWVVASDGGTAHLCSLVAPVLSIFGGSPFRRYAPFGRWNRLLTLELSCSPCCQYTSNAVNGCLSTECLVGIAPHQVRHALNAVHEEIGACSVDIGDGCRLYFGTSHLDRAELEHGYGR